jgi:hypothetical protein
MCLSILRKSKEYKTAKAINEKKYFKIFSKYGMLKPDGTLEMKSSAEMQEYFLNKVITTYQETQIKDSDNSMIKKHEKSYFEIWKTDPDMREYIDYHFQCNPMKFNKQIFNKFSGFDHFEENHTENYNKKKQTKAHKVSFEKAYDHILSICGDDPDALDYFLNYLAQLVQQTDIIPDVCMVFISPEGVGKDILFDFLMRVVGKKYCVKTERIESIVGNFNEQIEGRLLIIINETEPEDSKSRDNQIKSLITATEMMIHQKNKDHKTIDNFARIIFFSNKPFAFPIESGSRRPNIIKTSERNLKINLGEAENFRYFDCLNNKTEGVYHNVDFQEAFLNMLKDRDISKFNPRIFKKSEFHNDLLEYAVPLPALYLKEFVEEIEKKNPINKTMQISQSFTLENLHEGFNAYIEHGKYKYATTIKKLSLDLKTTYQLEKTKASKATYIIHFNNLKKLLIKNYNLTFTHMPKIESDSIDKYIPEVKKEAILDYKAMYEKLLLEKQEKDNKIEDSDEEDSYTENISVYTFKSKEQDEMSEISSDETDYSKLTFKSREKPLEKTKKQIKKDKEDEQYEKLKLKRNNQLIIESNIFTLFI